MSRWEYITPTWTPQGDSSLADAEFTIKYYEDIFTKVDDAPSSADRTWVMKTDLRGTVQLRSTYKISGSDFFYDGLIPKIPEGTLVIEETKQPVGYLMPSAGATGKEAKTFVMTIQFDSSNTKSTRSLYDWKGNAINDWSQKNIPVGNEPTDTLIAQQETPVSGDVSIIKSDAESEAAQGDASIAGIRFAVVNRSDNAVKVGNASYDKGQVVRILTTDANGRCRTANKALPYGTYQVYELRSDATIKAGEAYNGSDKPPFPSFPFRS